MRRRVKGGGPCAVCGEPAKAQGLCQKHYDRQRRRGSATAADAVHERWDLDPIRKRMFHNAKRRAQLKGIQFDLTGADIVIPEFCPVLGIKLTPGIKNFVDSSPSLDRLRPQRGYVPGNVRVISWRANRIKNDSTLEELEHIVRYLKDVA